MEESMKTPRQELEEIGGEPLESSGFEGETPEPNDTEEPAPAKP